MVLPARLPQLFLLGILAYLPVRQLAGRLIESAGAPTGAVFISQILPELLLLLGIVLSLMRRRLSRSHPLIWLALGLLTWSLLTALYHPTDLGQGWVGIRHDFIGLFALILVWLSGGGERSRIFRLLEGGLILLAAVSVLHFLVGPAFSDWLGYQRHYVGVIPQVHSLLFSPNQLGSLMVLGAVLAIRRAQGRQQVALLAGYGLVIGLTYSRSAWIAAGVFGAGFFIHRLVRARAIDWRPLLLGLALLVGMSAGMLRYGEGWRAVILHGESTRQHEVAAAEALGGREWDALFLGEGIGTAGPASFRTEEPKIAESWYLQLVQEIGLFGLALYLALFTLAVLSFFRAGEPTLGWLSLGLAANALFLHTWADNYYLNLVFWLIVAVIVLPMKQKEEPS